MDLTSNFDNSYTSINTDYTKVENFLDSDDAVDNTGIGQMNPISTGIVTVNSGDLLIDHKTYGDAQIIVNDGGFATVITMYDSAQFTVNNGGFVYGNSFENNSVTVNSGGLAVSNYINDRLRFHPNEENDGDYPYFNNFIVSNGGSAVFNYISSGGTLTVNSGGSAFYNYINNFDGNDRKGENYPSIEGGILHVGNNGKAFYNYISANGNLAVDNEGSAFANDISSGGTLTVNSGGLAVSNYISSGGTLTVNSGGGIVSNYINSGGNLTINSGGSALSNYISSGGTLTINSGGWTNMDTVYSNGSVIVSSGGVIDNGSIKSGGSAILYDGAMLSGIVTLEAGGYAYITTHTGGTIYLHGKSTVPLLGTQRDYDPTTQKTGLVISGTGSVTTVISGFTGDPSNPIILANVQTSNVTNVAYPDVNHVTFTLKDGQTTTLNVTGIGDYGYALGSDPNGNLTYEVCFLTGSMIRTLNGEIAVEDIRIGDQVLTFDWKLNKEISSPVRWVGSKTIKVNPTLMDDEAGYPVRIVKNAIAEGIPYKDLLITAEHSLFFEDKLIPVRMLVNGYSIYYDYSITDYTYYHIETDRHSVIWADGMLTETYLDTGNRNQFKQHGDCVVLTPVYTPKQWEQDAVAALGVERHIVEPLYQAITQRAMNMGLKSMQTEKQFTQNPNLHLITQDGLAIQPMSNYKGQYTFFLPDGDIEHVYLVSRASRESDIIGAFIDNRHHLGVLVGDISILAVDQQNNVRVDPITTHLSQNDLSGWHAVENASYRWTDGKALLKLPQNNLKKRRLVIQVCSNRTYIIHSQKEELIAV